MRNLLACVLIFFFCTLNSYADRVAIIGGGAAGLVSAWLLEQQHQVTLYERREHLGGHAYTVVVNLNGEKIPIEAAADYFNEDSYPFFLRLLHQLKTPIREFTLVVNFYRTDGSDTVILPPYHDGKVEWISLKPKNLVRLTQLGLVLNKAKKIIEQNNPFLSVQECIHGLLLDNKFKMDFLYPILGAGWGVSPDEISGFSALNTLKYLVDSYQSSFKWYEVRDGFSSYIDTVKNDLQHTTIRLNTRITHINKIKNSYTVTSEDGHTEEFDHVIFATEQRFVADLLKGLPEKSPMIDALERTKQIFTTIAIHGDRRFMPPNEADWRIANIRYNGRDSALTVYRPWLKYPIFKSWITYDVRDPADKGSAMPSPLYALQYFVHSRTDKAYYDVQALLRKEQGINNLWFVGVWTYMRDIHESAILSAVQVARRLAPDSDRVKIFADMPVD